MCEHGDKLEHQDWFAPAKIECPICGSSNFWKMTYTADCSGCWMDAAWRCNPITSDRYSGHYACLGCKNQVDIAVTEIVKDLLEHPPRSYESTMARDVIGRGLEKTDDGELTTSVIRARDRRYKETGKWPHFM